MSERLRERRYGPRIRIEIVKRGVETYEKQVARAKEGTFPLYRPEGYKKDIRMKKEEKEEGIMIHTMFVLLHPMESWRKEDWG